MVYSSFPDSFSITEKKRIAKSYYPFTTGLGRDDSDTENVEVPQPAEGEPNHQHFAKKKDSKCLLGHLLTDTPD